MKKIDIKKPHMKGPDLKELGVEKEDPDTIFEVHGHKGTGAFGAVFQASYKSNPDKIVAIKIIQVALKAGQHGEDIENVRKEIQFLRECDHGNVTQFHEAYYKRGSLWIVMEYCGGGSVGDIARKRRFGETEIAVILRESLKGLVYLHSRHKIHRDIKGGNILLTDTGHIKIADFGVSAQLKDTMSRRGTFVGTSYWMAPEMIQDSEYDYKADVWSLGITAIELADQKPPLFDEHPMRVLLRIPRNPSPEFNNPKDWSTSFCQFLAYLLTKDPQTRPSAEECLQHPFIKNVAHIDGVMSDGTLVYRPLAAPEILMEGQDTEESISEESNESILEEEVREIGSEDIHEANAEKGKIDIHEEDIHGYVETEITMRDDYFQPDKTSTNSHVLDTSEAGHEGEERSECARMSPMENFESNATFENEASHDHNSIPRASAVESSDRVTDIDTPVMSEARAAEVLSSPKATPPPVVDTEKCLVLNEHQNPSPSPSPSKSPWISRESAKNASPTPSQSSIKRVPRWTALNPKHHQTSRNTHVASGGVLEQQSGAPNLVRSCVSFWQTIRQDDMDEMLTNPATCDEMFQRFRNSLVDTLRDAGGHVSEQEMLESYLQASPGTYPDSYVEQHAGRYLASATSIRAFREFLNTQIDVATELRTFMSRHPHASAGLRLDSRTFFKCINAAGQASYDRGLEMCQSFGIKSSHDDPVHRNSISGLGICPKTPREAQECQKILQMTRRTFAMKS